MCTIFHETAKVRIWVDISFLNKYLCLNNTMLSILEYLFIKIIEWNPLKICLCSVCHSESKKQLNSFSSDMSWLWHCLPSRRLVESYHPRQTFTFTWKLFNNACLIVLVGQWRVLVADPLSCWYFCGSTE